MTSHRHHLGVYAVIKDSAGRLLTIRKARGPYTGHLDLPGGSMEDGETLEETLRREIREETGCTVTSSKQLETISPLTPYTKNGEAILFRHVAVLYACTVEGVPTTEGDGQDSHGTHWATPEDITHNGSPTARIAMQISQIS